MDAEQLRHECWSAARPRRAEVPTTLQALVSEDPEGSWAAIREWIRDAATPEEAEMYSTGLRALLTDGGWRARITAATDDDPHLAHCVADAVEDDPDLFHDRSFGWSCTDSVAAIVRS